MKRESKIRIVYLMDFFRTEQAGTEKQLMILLKNLPRDRFSINIISFQRSEFLEKFNRVVPDVDVTILDARSDISKSIPSLWKLYRILRLKKPDILHTFLPASNSFGVMVGKLAGIRRIISSRRDMGYWQTRKDLLITRFSNRFVSHVVANSYAVKKYVASSEGLNGERISVIYNAIDTGTPSVGAPDIKREQTPVAGIVSNLNRPVKRVDLFIRAAALVKKKHPEAKFWVIGDGVLKLNLEGLASELGLNPNIVFWGRRGDVQELIQGMTVGVICSDSEGFSNSIMEYMAYGIPVVATQTGGNAELVEHGKTGVLVSPGNHQSLAEGILQCIEERKKAVRMGEEGRKRIVEEYSIKRMIQATMILYEEVLIHKESIT